MSLDNENGRNNMFDDISDSDAEKIEDIELDESLFFSDDSEDDKNESGEDAISDIDDFAGQLGDAVEEETGNVPETTVPDEKEDTGDEDVGSEFVQDETAGTDEDDEYADWSTDQLIEKYIEESSRLYAEGHAVNDEGISSDAADISEQVSSSLENAAEEETEEDEKVQADFEGIETDPSEKQVGTTDMNLRIAFGLEDTRDDMTEKSVRKKQNEYERKSREIKQFKPDHPEYTDVTQSRDIAAEFRTKKRNGSIRLVIALLTAIGLLIYENIPGIYTLLTGNAYRYPETFNPSVYPVVFVMVGLQMLLICVIMALPELKRGIVKLFTGAPSPESLTFVALAVSVVVSVITAVNATPLDPPVTYNTVPAFLIVMTLVYSNMNISKNMKAFYVISSKKQKFVLEDSDEAEILSEDSDGEYFGETFKVTKAGFVDEFFTKLSIPGRSTVGVMAVLLAVLAADIILNVVLSTQSAGSVSDVITRTTVSVFAVCPFSIFLAYGYPFARVASLAYETDSAILGDSSAELYANTSVITVDDSIVFPSFGVKVQNIRIYNNARIDRVLYYASSVFSATKGPLSDVFEVATMEMGLSDDVKITDVDHEFLSAQVDGVNISFGSFNSLTEKGFAISDEMCSDDADFLDELSIMYMFRENILVSKMYIKYIVDGDIEPTLAQLSSNGMTLCVKTFDPNITDEMLISKLNLKSPPVRILRYQTEDTPHMFNERSSSGIASTSSPKSLLQLLPYCIKAIHTRKTCIVLSVMYIVISILLFALFLVSSRLAEISSLIIVIYNIVWMIPSFLAVRIFLR